MTGRLYELIVRTGRAVLSIRKQFRSGRRPGTLGPVNLPDENKSGNNTYNYELFRKSKKCAKKR